MVRTVLIDGQWGDMTIATKLITRHHGDGKMLNLLFLENSDGSSADTLGSKGR